MSSDSTEREWLLILGALAAGVCLALSVFHLPWWNIAADGGVAFSVGPAGLSLCHVAGCSREPLTSLAASPWDKIGAFLLAAAGFTSVSLGAVAAVALLGRGIPLWLIRLTGGLALLCIFVGIAFAGLAPDLPGARPATGMWGTFGSIALGVVVISVRGRRSFVG